MSEGPIQTKGRVTAPGQEVGDIPNDGDRGGRGSQEDLSQMRSLALIVLLGSAGDHVMDQSRDNGKDSDPTHDGKDMLRPGFELLFEEPRHLWKLPALNCQLRLPRKLIDPLKIIAEKVIKWDKRPRKWRLGPLNLGTVSQHGRAMSPPDCRIGQVV